MAGGTWEVTNKKQPGFYIRFRSAPQTITTVGDRGIVTIAKSLSWGESGEVVQISSPSDTLNKLGYDITSDEMRFAREIFKGTTTTSGAAQILFYRLSGTGGVAATVAIDNLTATAKYQGIRGNDITVVITADPETPTDEEDTYAVFTVDTIVDGLVRDSQTVGSWTSSTDNTPATVGDLVSNDWVNFTGTASALITPSAGVPLVGGVDPTVTTAAYSEYLTAIEPFLFNILIYDGEDATIKSTISTFMRSLAENSGRWSQAVVANYPNADRYFIISVGNGYVDNIGYEFTAEEATWWVGGAEAGATNFESLTYRIHPDAVEVKPALNYEARDESIDNGSLVLIEEFNQVKIMTDINTFTSFTPDNGKAYSKNRVIRVVFGLANDLYQTFARDYIGKIDNTAEGRNLYKAATIAYCVGLQGNNAIQNFTADDVEVFPVEGTTDSVIINIWLQPVDAIEKIYTTVTIA